MYSIVERGIIMSTKAYREANKAKVKDSNKRYAANRTQETIVKRKKKLHESRTLRYQQIKSFKEIIGCQIPGCGYNTTGSAIDFHHINPATKIFCVGAKIHYSKIRVRAEIAKCCVLCCRCHREFHAGIITELPPPLGDKAMELCLN